MNEIQIVIVLYQNRLEDSITYKSLQENINMISCPVKLLIYNNSSEIKVNESEKYTLVNATNNGKLAEAYNYALQICIERSSDWLLLLDQDTTLTKEYFNALDKALNDGHIGDDIVSIVPIIISDNDRQLSPLSYSKRLGPFFFRKVKLGACKKCIVAFNTVSLLNVSILMKLKQRAENNEFFSKEFSLDYLDFYYYYIFNKSHYSVYVLDAKLHHNLSVLNYDIGMNKGRYISILEAEKRFIKKIGSLSITLYFFYSILRSFKQIFIKSKKRYVKITLFHAFGLKNYI